MLRRPRLVRVLREYPMTATKIIRTVLFVLILSAGTLSLTACNTVEGAGKDTERLGEKTQDVARDAKD
jgi:predicted small secreted protein